MKKEDYYKFILALGVVLALFGFVNVFALNLSSQILMGVVGILLVILAGILLIRKNNHDSG